MVKTEFFLLIYALEKENNTYNEINFKHKMTFYMKWIKYILALCGLRDFILII